MLDWIKECVRVDIQGKVTVAALYASYVDWSTRNNKYIRSCKALSQALRKAGYEPYRTGGKRYMLGLSLVPHSVI